MPDRWAADAPGVERAAAVLRDGGLVAFPTDTVYGIGCRAGDPAALELLFAAKRRSPEKAIPWLIAAADDAATAGYPLTDAARRLMERWWPGPMTIVLGGQDGRSQAFRVPAHSVALELLALSGRLAASSANRSGEPDTLDADEVAVAFADAAPAELDAILDGGPVPGGVASTVVDLSGERPRLVREGPVTRAEVEAVIGPID